MAGPDAAFWQARFEAGQIPWDRGSVHPAVERVAAKGAPAQGSILIPGCGSGWEVVEWARRGLAVTAVDYAPAALERTAARLRAAGLSARLEACDVLEFSPAEPFDYVWEQTCWCALYPDRWQAYAERLHGWLKPGGTLHFLAMQAVRPEAMAQGRIEGPPYHTDINAVRALLPATQWEWPEPPYAHLPHPHAPWYELAFALRRR